MPITLKGPAGLNVRIMDIDKMVSDNPSIFSSTIKVRILHNPTSTHLAPFIDVLVNWIIIIPGKDTWEFRAKLGAVSLLENEPRERELTLHVEGVVTITKPTAKIVRSWHKEQP